MPDRWTVGDIVCINSLYDIRKDAFERIEHVPNLMTFCNSAQSWIVAAHSRFASEVQSPQVQSERIPFAIWRVIRKDMGCRTTLCPSTVNVSTAPGLYLQTGKIYD